MVIFAAATGMRAGEWVALEHRDIDGGDDTFDALFLPPPDDDLPGPEGTRQVTFEVVADEEDDVVAVRNMTDGTLFDLAVAALMGGGDDLLEAAGEMTLWAEPGLGLDTARVSRNLLPFVSALERVELLEGGG